MIAHVAAWGFLAPMMGSPVSPTMGTSFTRAATWAVIWPP